MTRTKFGCWELLHDPEATSQAYRSAPHGAAEYCPCDGCKNYILARTKLFSAKTLKLLTALGIDSSRETYVAYCGDDDDHIYTLSFILIGRVIWQEFHDSLGFGVPIGKGLYITVAPQITFAPSVLWIRDAFPQNGGIVEIGMTATEVPWLLHEKDSC